MSPADRLKVSILKTEGAENPYGEFGSSCDLAKRDVLSYGKSKKRINIFTIYWYLLKTMESAIFGLVGVALGGLLPLAREWWFKRRQEAKDAGFLVILVSRQLDLIVSQCALVVADGGKPGMGNYYYANTSTPRFKLELLEVEWKSLPVGLMYKIFDFQF